MPAALRTKYQPHEQGESYKWKMKTTWEERQKNEEDPLKKMRSERKRTKMQEEEKKKTKMEKEQRGKDNEDEMTWRILRRCLRRRRRRQQNLSKVFNPTADK